MSNNKKTNYKNNKKGNVTNNREVVKNNVRKEEVKVTKVADVKNEEVRKEKKSFSLDSKQRDIILILLVVVLLVVGLILTSGKGDKFSVELPIALSGEAGFTEITYDQYEEKVNNEESLVVIIVRDSCGYCEMNEPIVSEVANEYKLPIYYINLTNLSDEEIDLLSTTNAYLKKNDWGTPTTLFMYGAHVVDSISGYVEKDALVDFVKENFKVEE